VDRPQPVAQLDEALADEALHRLRRLRQHTPVGAIARGLQRENEAFRRFGAPFGPARGLEARIVRAVDLDRGELAAGELHVALLAQSFGVEHTAPRLEGPAADADIDLSGHAGSISDFGRVSGISVRIVTNPDTPKNARTAKASPLPKPSLT